MHPDAETSPVDQHRYQVRLEWGAEGLDRLAAADIVVVVDVLRFSTTVTGRVAAGAHVPHAAGAHVPHDGGAHAGSRNGAVVAAHAAETGALVLLGCLRNATAVAEAVAAEQLRRSERTSVAVIAAGEHTAPGPASALRFAVEDLLGAGAIIASLGKVGIDHTSPEAAAAAEAFRGLRGATRHLLTACGSGQELLARGLADEVHAAAELDATASVPVLRDGEFTAWP